MKIFLDMVGCRLNQSELETYARQFRLAGHALTPDAAMADLIVINTCTVTAAAAADSRQMIRRAARYGTDQIVVTGCWSTINPKETAELRGVSRIIDNQEKDQLVSTILNIPISKLEPGAIQREPIPGTRLRTRAFIKVQDGCDNTCTYCITRLARGPARSRQVHSVLEDIKSALNGGAQEIVLAGVHLGSWGHDFESPSHLSILIRSILTETDTPRIRLSSLEPWDISAEFFGLWQNPRLCRHVHLPLQSGCETTLRRMGRRITPKSYADLIRQTRLSIPGVAITTDIITGFPGESEAEFSESAAFITEMDFSGGHVFTYSVRPETVAALLPDQIPLIISKGRSARIREILQKSSDAYQTDHLGQELHVLWEKAIPVSDDQWLLSGLTDNYLRVTATSATPCHNQMMNVLITGMKNGGLVGEINSTCTGLLSLQDTL